ncbi:hypothetical protein Sme01_71870 [Sphaerisporangium melleum]|uniref:VWFA domain-containing protein n=1 Tax=Sphaerisporangium melleum TaxID=321316 RepID=A0A917VV16_9ACTN|nr:substrate-binding and VWA domain-containing protein [Sphaerisporangium melleum]GGL17307.1 hypothetical protein GCM10007964_69130 [Sphaerisporangium melleum]GII74711.1 hypothetical protein Sme01_71870 [Sphaerisporangium melleum]
MTGRHRNPEHPDGDERYEEDGPSWRDRLASLLEAVRESAPLATAHGRAITAVVLGVLLLGSLAGGAYALVSRSMCAERPGLRVTAAPEIGPALERVAEKYTQQGGCAEITIRQGSPADVADELAARKNLMDVWVPDASVWVDLARVQGADRTSLGAGTPIARSPVIMAVAESTVTRLASAKVKPSWTLLVPTAATRKKLPKASTTLPAPSRFASGLAALDALSSVVTDRPAMLKIVNGMTTNLRRSVLPSQEALFDLVERPAKGTDPIIVVSEQAVWEYNSDRANTRVAGLYPQEGTLALDYPFVPVTKDALKRQAAEEFRRIVLSAAGRAILQSYGFRDAAGQAGGAMDEAHGVRAEPPRELTVPDAMARLRVLLSMRMLLADTRTLLLLDVSRSMAEEVPGLGTSRVRAMADAAEAGVRALPQGGDVGLWIFAAGLDGDKDHRQLVPVGPLAQQGPEVVRALRKLPGQVGGGSGLYDALLAAFRSASKSQVKNMLSSIVVFTDGGDDDRRGIKLKELLATLEKEFDAGRPVTVTLVGFGEDVDVSALEQIARVTNGAAMVAGGFDQAQQIFLQTLANRVCVDRERCAAQEG